MLPGPFGSVESRTAFAQLELELAANLHHIPCSMNRKVSVNEMMLAFPWRLSSLRERH
jgi:hypothetical protein